MDISLPSLTITMNKDEGEDDDKDNQGKVKVESSPITPILHVGLHVLRPNGLAISGTLRSTIGNDHTFCGAQLSFAQTIPAVLVTRWQSLKIQCGTTGCLSWTDLANSSITWRPDDSVDMQFRYELPPASSIFLSRLTTIQHSFRLIPYRAMPIVVLNCQFASTCTSTICTGSPISTGTHARTAQLYSQSVLLLTPLPDMGMPFNVLSLLCTLFAFIVGSLINILVRQGTEHVKDQLSPITKPKSKLDRLWKKTRFEPAKY
jgi:hypothetical protein